MTYKIKHWSLLLLSTMMAINMFAYDIAAENADGITLYYDIINDGKELEVVSSNYAYDITGALIIPEEVTFMNRTRKVTSISSGAFSYCRLTNVDLPSSLTSIKDNAFFSCVMLVSVKIPDSVTDIGETAFSGCSRLSSFVCGKSIKSIGDFAFNFCKELTTISLPKSLDFIGNGIFTGCFY